MAAEADLTKIISPAFTENVLLDIVRKKSNYKDVSIFNVRFGDGSRKGESYLSKVTRVTIEAKTEDKCGNNIKEFQVHVIIKSIPESLARVKTFRSFDFFYSEIAFYETIWPALDAFQKSKNLSDPYESIPLCLATFANGKKDFIVLQDVSYEGYITVSRTDALDLDLTTCILKNFAKFHALSVAYKDQNPIEFQKIVDSVQENYFHERLRGWYTKIMHKYFEVAKDVAKKELSVSYFEKINEVLSVDLYGNICKAFQEDTKFRAINHGDCWAPNILLRGSNDDREMVLIDFQLVRYTSVAIDILFFLYTCVDPNVRDQHWDFLLKQYYETFTDMLDKLGTTLDITFDSFKEEIKKYGFCGFGMCVDALVMSLLDDDDVIDVDAIEGDEEIPVDEVWIVNPIKDVEKRKRVASFLKHVVDNGFI